MDFLKRLFGDDDAPARPQPTMAGRRERTPDEQAVERYRYLLRTAPPETIEEAHAEGFARLTPEQRRMVLQELDHTIPPAERSAGVSYDDQPRSLARLATRAEMRQPGTLERTWSGMPATDGPPGLGAGSMFMGNFMGAFAGVMLGSMVADAFLGDAGYDLGAGDPGGFDIGDTADAGMGDAGFGEAGSFGDFGGIGDFGGFGDFGGDF